MRLFAYIFIILCIIIGLFTFHLIRVNVRKNMGEKTVRFTDTFVSWKEKNMLPVKGAMSGNDIKNSQKR